MMQLLARCPYDMLASLYLYLSWVYLIITMLKLWVYKLIPLNILHVNLSIKGC